MKWWIIGVVILVIVGVYVFSSDVLLAPKQIAVGLPDLTRSIAITNVVNKTNNGTTIYFINYTISYKNIGNVVSTNVTAYLGDSMVCNGTGVGGGGGGGFSIPVLNPGQSINYPFYSIVYCRGLFTAFANVDIYNSIQEISETNNNASVSRII